MDFFELIQKRRSVRAYKRSPVEQEKLTAVLEAARLAPSAGDLQSYEVVVVRSDERKMILAAAAFDQTFIVAAPVVLVFVADPDRSRPQYGDRGASLYCIQDATLAAGYAQLAGVASGLASCWIGAFDPRAVAAAVEARPPAVAVALLALGHSAETPDRMPRRTLGEFVYHEVMGRRS